MPHVTQGFTGNEILERVISYIGDTSAAFRTYMQNTIPMAESRYCKTTDWSFLKKTDLSLAVTSGTKQYTINAATIGYEMDTANIELVSCPAESIVLKKVNLADLRRMDPEEDEGTSTDTPTLWAQVSDTIIEIWPPTFKTTTLKIQGKISPAGNLMTLSNYPLMPFENQDGFVDYCMALGLDYTDDPRAESVRQRALQQIQQDVVDEIEHLGDIEEPRVRSIYEFRLDGVGANLNALLFGWLERD